MSILKFAKKHSKRAEREEKIKKTSKVKAAPKKKKSQSRKVTKGHESNLDLQPLVTEKGVTMQEDGFAVFRVPTKTTKGQVKQAIRARFKVNPIMVRSMRMAPKKRRRGATVGKTAAWKKVYVKVDDIQKLVSGP
jgi:large subunit ribosomal protein L23